MKRDLRRYRTKVLSLKRLNQIKFSKLFDSYFMENKLNYLSKNRPLSCPHGQSKCYSCRHLDKESVRIKNTYKILEMEEYEREEIHV
jgi:hypothetical protein